MKPLKTKPILRSPAAAVLRRMGKSIVPGRKGKGTYKRTLKHKSLEYT